MFLWLSHSYIILSVSGLHRWHEAHHHGLCCVCLLSEPHIDRSRLCDRMRSHPDVYVFTEHQPVAMVSKRN